MTLKNVTNAFGLGISCIEGTCGSLVGAGAVLGLIRKDKAQSMKERIEYLSGRKNIADKFCNYAFSLHFILVYKQYDLIH